ncbi:MAG: hypothetical protein E1N59_2019 [Puniceicoccaceae bacterium 5H]|nr:MAG: hypothetical protein E1N59_2019 [Puniceicoccaceae bacterium 5H]
MASTLHTAQTSAQPHRRISTQPYNRARALRRVERVSRFMDTAFRVPGLKKRVGWDAIIGLIPGIGDTVTAVISFYPIYESLRMGAPRLLVLRMLANVGIDWLVGIVPVFGDIFDFAFRANIRNTALLKRWLEQG